ncbi:MAG: polysaccharide deacetylase family protein [Bacteriovoracia bacterium]
MSYLTSAFLVLLLVLVSCSVIPEKRDSLRRKVASDNKEMISSKKLHDKVNNILDGIVHGYLIGQVHLEAFDKELEKNAENALSSDSYSSLLAVRTFIDEYEHELNELYLDMVLVSALPEYDVEQKLSAGFALEKIENFLEGTRPDDRPIPENLKPLILSRLVEKRQSLHDDIKALHDDPQLSNNDQDVKQVLFSKMKSLISKDFSYTKKLEKYFVNHKTLNSQIREERKKRNFQEMENEIQSLSQEIRKYTSESRPLISRTIEPSGNPNGNITGSTFPPRTWALTYDDGPGSKTTEQVIDNLVARKIPATFFVLAKQVMAYPETAKKIVSSGLEIANHSYTHAQLTKVGPSQLEREIGTSKRVIEEQLDVPVKLFRLPYGAGVSTPKTRLKIAEHKMVHVFWNVDTLDWQDKNPQSILERTLKQMRASKKNAGIVLFHDIHTQSVTASTMLMDHFNKEGLTVCTVQNIIDQLNQSLPTCK